MVKIFIALCAGVGFYFGIDYFWEGSRGVLFIHNGYPFTYKLILALLISAVSLTVK